MSFATWPVTWPVGEAKSSAATLASRCAEVVKVVGERAQRVEHFERIQPALNSSRSHSTA